MAGLQSSSPGRNTTLEVSSRGGARPVSARPSDQHHSVHSIAAAAPPPPARPRRYGYRYPCMNEAYRAGLTDLCELPPVAFRGCPCRRGRGREGGGAEGGPGRGGGVFSLNSDAASSKPLNLRVAARLVTPRLHHAHSLSPPLCAAAAPCPPVMPPALSSATLPFGAGSGAAAATAPRPAPPPAAAAVLVPQPAMRAMCSLLNLSMQQLASGHWAKAKWRGRGRWCASRQWRTHCRPAPMHAAALRTSRSAMPSRQGG